MSLEGGRLYFSFECVFRALSPAFLFYLSLIMNSFTYFCFLFFVFFSLSTLLITLATNNDNPSLRPPSRHDRGKVADKLADGWNLQVN